MPSWSIEPVGGIWTVAALAALLTPLLAIGPNAQNFPRRRRYALVALRGLTLAMLLGLLLRPALEYKTQRKLPGTLVLLADQSRSMQVADSLNNRTRWDALRSTLDQSSAELAELAETWEIRLYPFSDESSLAPMNDGRFDLPEQPEGSQTAIGAALDDALAREAQQRVVGVLLLSDGAQRAFAPRDLPPQTVARRMASDGIPLYTFAFGQPATGQQADLRLSDLLISDAVFVDTPAEAQALVASSGYANQTFNVQLLWENDDGDMEAVDSQQITIEPRRQRFPVRLSHTPKQPGEYKVTVRVETPEGELVTANNEQSTFVSVLKGGINVLYLAGAARIGGGPGIEPRFVRAALAGFPDVSVEYQLIDYRTLQIDLRDRLRDAEYDVFLLGDVDVAGLSTRTWREIAAAVEGGAGLGMLGGFHSFGPGGYRGSPISDVLPIELRRLERQPFGEPIRPDVHLPGPLRMAPIAQLGGEVHPILRIREGVDASAAWAELPTLDGANLFDRLAIKDNARVIAEADNAQRSPLLVLGAWGSGRTAALAVDSTWHWQLEGFGEIHRRFWRQLILWLAQKDETEGRRVWVRLDQRRFQQGARVEFTLGAEDDEGQPIASAEYQVDVEKPDGTSDTVRVTPRSDQSTAIFSETAQPGDYRIRVAAADGGVPVGDATARFSVSDQDVELDQPAAEPTLLAALARITADAGGDGMAPEELPGLLEQLKSKARSFEEEIVRTVTLWDTWPALLAFVGLLTTEWFLRKRWGIA